MPASDTPSPELDPSGRGCALALGHAGPHQSEAAVDPVVPSSPVVLKANRTSKPPSPGSRLGGSLLIGAGVAVVVGSGLSIGGLRYASPLFLAFLGLPLIAGIGAVRGKVWAQVLGVVVGFGYGILGPVGMFLAMLTEGVSVSPAFIAWEVTVVLAGMLLFITLWARDG